MTEATATPETTVTPETPKTPATPASLSRHHINTYMLAAAGAALVPIPVVDMAGVAGVQVKLIHSISKEYGVEFRQDMVKSIVAGLLGSFGVSRLFGAATAMALKVIPGVGTAMASLTLPVLAAASTYAIGQVFIQHYETGGTLLDFNAEKMKDYYNKMFEEGKAAVQGQAEAK